MFEIIILKNRPTYPPELGGKGGYVD